MKWGRLGNRVLLIALVVASFTGSLQFVHRAHAAGTLSIDPPSQSPSPAGTVVSVNVRVDGMDQFNAWHIEISTNTTALNGTSIDYSGQSIFSPSSVLQEVSCVNGKQVPGGSQSCTDPRMGIVEAQGFVLGSNLPQAPISGVIFTINYLAGQYNFTYLNFVIGGIYLANGSCSGSGCDVVHDNVGSLYGTPPAPDFSLSLKAQSVSVALGSSANDTLSVSSVHDFVGQINFTYTPVIAGIFVTFVPNNVTLNNSTATATISITTSISTGSDYQLYVEGNSTGLSHSAPLDVHVETPPDFKIDSSPGQLQLLQGTSGMVIITVSTDTGFRGNVTLQIQTPVYNFFNRTIYQTANASLAQSSLVIGSRGSNSTVMFISVPLSFYAFRYQINVTATSVSNPSLTHTREVIVVPPAFNLLPTVDLTALTITAGHSGFATFSVTSVNYFLGYIYPSSTMSVGSARFNESYKGLDVGGTVSFSVNVTIDPATLAGDYAVLLTATGLAPSGQAVVRSIGEPIVVLSNGNHLVVQLPTKVLGLAIPVYFGILGGFAAIFVLLAALVYRKNRSDKDEWE